MEKTFDTNTTFADLGIIPPILNALREMGFEYPTEVQSRAIPHVLNKEDLIVMSKTGSGKTAVFGESMLQLIDPEAEGPQGLILTPTRELAVQVDSDIRQMAKFLPHRTTAVYGQHSMDAEVKELEKGTAIVTGTPGRVYDHIRQGTLKTKHINFLVLDEADRMLDMGFIDQVERIIRSVPRNRVTMLFSATMPTEIKRICRRYMKEPETIEIESQTKTVDAIRQLYYKVDEREKRDQLHRILLAERPESCMIFCNTRIAVDRVRNFLTKKGYACYALHGDIPQSRRMKTIQQFKQGKFRILVATDVAARGIHIDELALVVNYDVPVEKDSYVHRIGRTGRAGHEGCAISIVTSNDIMDLYAIEEHIGVLIEECELPGDEFLTEHKQEIDEWIKANSARRTETDRPSRTKSGQRDRARPDRRKKAGGQNRRKGAPQEHANQSIPEEKGPSGVRKSSTKDTANRQGQAAAKQKKRTAPGRPHHRNADRIQSGSTAGTDGAYKGKSGDGAYRHKDRSDRRRPDTVKRSDRVSRDAGKTQSISDSAKQKRQDNAARKQQAAKPAGKKGFLKRLVDKLTGKS